MGTTGGTYSAHVFRPVMCMPKEVESEKMTKATRPGPCLIKVQKIPILLKNLQECYLVFMLIDENL